MTNFNLSAVEKHVIMKCLHHHNGNRTHACNDLGISVRTLRNKLNIYKKNPHISLEDKVILGLVAPQKN